MLVLFVYVSLSDLLSAVVQGSLGCSQCVPRQAGLQVHVYSRPDSVDGEQVPPFRHGRFALHRSLMMQRGSVAGDGADVSTKLWHATRKRTWTAGPRVRKVIHLYILSNLEILFREIYDYKQCVFF